MSSEISFEGQAHHFDQAHSAALKALRSERKAFFLMVAGEDGLEQPTYAFSINGNGQELWQFFADIIVTAEAEMNDIERASKGGD